MQGWRPPITNAGARHAPLPLSPGRRSRVVVTASGVKQPRLAAQEAPVRQPADRGGASPSVPCKSAILHAAAPAVLSATSESRTNLRTPASTAGWFTGLTSCPLWCTGSRPKQARSTLCSRDKHVSATVPLNDCFRSSGRAQRGERFGDIAIVPIRLCASRNALSDSPRRSRPSRRRRTIAFDGEQSRAGGKRHDRSATNGITPASARHRSHRSPALLSSRRSPRRRSTCPEPSSQASRRTIAFA
jgi:hypothetical protein